MPRIEEVFRLSGIPTYTFVEPSKYDEIKVSIRTPGRCLVLEGPSGIGKTTTVTRAIRDLGLEGKVISLTARKKADVDLVSSLPEMQDIGTVIVDDFHRLTDDVKARLSDYMKILADAETETSKLILIGINKAGQQLVKFAHDLGMRIDVFRLESNPSEKIEELISLGEKVLNITISAKSDIAKAAQGSFHIGQVLAHKVCTQCKVLETEPDRRTLETAISTIVEEVMIDLGRQFKESVLTFVRGSKLRREGRAPYLHILKWLAEGDEWSLDLGDALAAHPEMKGSVGQVLEKGYLSALLNDAEKRPLLEPFFHFEQSTGVLSVEDPKLIFYLKNLVWRSFTRQAGFKSDYFKYKWDFALSFAGADRAIAKRLQEILSEREVQTFYDENLQSALIGRDIEEYLGPIYRTEARYVVPLLSRSYPTRIWTKFESEQFKERFGTNSVLAVRFSDIAPGLFSNDQKYGSLAFNPGEEMERQLQAIADTLCARILEDRAQADDAN